MFTDYTTTLKKNLKTQSFRVHHAKAMIEPRTDRELVGGDVEGGNARDGEQEEEREEKHASLKRHGRALGRKRVQKQHRWFVYKREEKKEGRR